MGSWAAEPGGRQRCQAGIRVRMGASGAASPFSFLFSSASLHPSPPPLHHCLGHLHPLAVFRNCSNFLPCDPEPSSSPRHPQAGTGVSAEPPARCCAAATAAAPAMGERCDYQRLSSAEEEEEMLGPLPHSFSDSTGQRVLRPGSRCPAQPPRQDVAPGMPCRRVSAGGAGRGEQRGAPAWASPRGAGSCCGSWVSGWHGARGSLHGVSRYPAAPGMAWGWHPLHGCAPILTYGSRAACSFLMGKLRHGGMSCSSTAWSSLAQLGVGHSARRSTVSPSHSVTSSQQPCGLPSMSGGATGQLSGCVWVSRECIGACGGCSCLQEVLGCQCGLE